MRTLAHYLPVACTCSVSHAIPGDIFSQRDHNVSEQHACDIAQLPSLNNIYSEQSSGSDDQLPRVHRSRTPTSSASFGPSNEGGAVLAADRQRLSCRWGPSRVLRSITVDPREAIVAALRVVRELLGAWLKTTLGLLSLL